MDSAIIVPHNQYDPVLEEKVKYYLSIIPELPKNDKRIIRAKTPEGTTPYELEIWQREEIRRIKEGHFGMSPKMYFFYNYVKMWDIESGLIRPEFRVCQQAWFTLIEECMKSQEWGVICVKRRRIGASWMEAADVMHDCITNTMFKVGMTSKTEADAVDLFKKVKFVYDNLPDWLRPTSSAGNTRSSIDFSYYTKDATGSRRKQGLQSEIVVKAPTDTSWEGSALRKLVFDEAGKIQNLKAIFSMANEVMRKGTRRVGTPLIFGTAGEVSKEGKDLKEMWYNAEIYKLKQFFYGGWNGLIVDQFGNDLTEEAVRWIVYERKRREGLSQKEYNDFLQQYPLTVQEAFTSNSNQGLGNQVKINRQLQSLYENPVKEKRGYFKLDKDENVVFRPDNRGACIIYEEPDPILRNGYLSGNDPTDNEVLDTRNRSSLSLIIMKKPNGIQPAKIVFEYTERPNIPRDFYEQALMALIYYNKCKVLVERNKSGIITYFDERGYKYLLQTAPQGHTRLMGGNTFNIGYYRTKSSKRYGEELTEEYVEAYCEYIPNKELLMELQNYGVINTDRADAFQACLMFLKEDKTKVSNSSEFKEKVPSFGMSRMGGRLVRNKRDQNGQTVHF